MRRRGEGEAMKPESSSIVFRVMKSFYRWVRSYDLESESDWWEHHLRRCTTIGDTSQRRAAFPAPLLPIVEEIGQRTGHRPKLLEIGPGPASLLAWGVEQDLFEITAIDPLAGRYQELLADHGLEYPVKPREGFAEELMVYFEPRSFDIVYSSNSLDHVMSPRKCMENIDLVVNRGGIVYLEGFCNEGSCGGWTGLHQHDLVPENGHLIHYDRKHRRTNLTENLDLSCVYESIVPFHERGIEAFGYESKDKAGGPSDWHYRDWYTMIFSARSNA